MTKSRSLANRAQDFVSVKDFGAKGDGTTDDTAAIQAAIDSLSALGGTLLFPKGQYVVKQAGANTWCLKFTKPIRIIGSGALYCSILPDSSVPSSVHILAFYPDPAYAVDFTSIEKIYIGNPSTGTRYGKCGVYCDTQTAGAYLPKFTMRDCGIATGNDYGFYHLNNVSNNVNGGMYCALIENNGIKGGINLAESGDSCVIRNNILSGPNIGVFASIATGASQLVIESNNITNTGGAIKIDRGFRAKILYNNCEQTGAGGSNGAMFDINGGNGVSPNIYIAHNHLGDFTNTGLTSMIRLRNTAGCKVEDNTLLFGGDGSAAFCNVIDVGATCTDTIIGRNQYSTNVAADASFTASCATNVLTVTGTPTGTIRVGQEVSGAFIPYGTTIISLGTGSGAAGTYNLSATVGTVASEPMTSGNSRKVLDNGTGTMGVVKQLTLQNSWVPFNYQYSQPTFWKDVHGVVHVEGVISGGTATAGTVMFNLPASFRPSLLHSCPTVSDSGSLTASYINVQANGDTKIQAGVNARFHLDGVSFFAGADFASNS